MDATVYSFMEWYKISQILTSFSYLSEPRLSCAYVSVFKIKYWQTFILVLYALTAIIAKI